MSTQVVIIGAEKKEKKKLVQIKFLNKLALSSDGNLVGHDAGLFEPSDYSVIELICLNYIKGFDLMYARHEIDDRKGTLFVGHFNDGVV